MEIIPKRGIWRKVFFLLVFFVVFFFSFLILMLIVGDRETKRTYLDLQRFLLEVESSSFQKLGGLQVERVSEKLFGKIVAIEEKSGTWKWIEDFHWSSKELSFIQKFRKRQKRRFSIPFFEIQAPQMLALLVPKILRRTLENPSFMVDHEISFRRADPFFKQSNNKIERFLLYRTLKISSQVYEPIGSNSQDTFLQNLGKTYLYTSHLEIRNPKLYRLSTSSVWKKNFIYVLYLPSLQGFISADIPSPTWNSIWKEDFIGGILCFWSSCAAVLLVMFFPTRVFYRKRKSR